MTEDERKKIIRKAQLKGFIWAGLVVIGLIILMIEISYITVKLVG